MSCTFLSKHGPEWTTSQRGQNSPSLVVFLKTLMVVGFPAPSVAGSSSSISSG